MSPRGPATMLPAARPSSRSRALQSAVARGTLAAPRRTLRFLWLPEIAGSQAWLVRHPEAARATVAGIHMDMVGGLLATTPRTFHLSPSAQSRPHVVDEIARAWLAAVVRPPQPDGGAG